MLISCDLVFSAARRECFWEVNACVMKLQFLKSFKQLKYFFYVSAKFTVTLTTWFMMGYFYAMTHFERSQVQFD